MPVVAPLALDLFCGAGNASNGLLEAGFQVVGFDKWLPAVQTSRANGHICMRVDVKRVRWRQWRDSEVFLMWGSPPCQPWSRAGLNHGELDPRDGFPAMLEAIEAVQPQVVLLENVKGMLSPKNIDYLHRIVGSLEKAGYEVQWRLWNTADFGVPQTRERVIIVAHRVPFVWPKRTHAKVPNRRKLKWASMEDACGWEGGTLDRRNWEDDGKGGRKLVALVSTERPAPTFTGEAGRQWKRTSMVGFARKSDHGKVTEDGLRARDLRDARLPAQTVTEKARSWQRRPASSRVLNPGRTATQPNRNLHPVDGPAPTVAFGNDAANWKWEEGSEAVRITVEEAAILQDFPPGYRFTGSRTSQYLQIGNAVPRTLARVMAQAALRSAP
jgi:DNA (cytosine-5)-methyltransferase 1